MLSEHYGRCRTRCFWSVCWRLKVKISWPLLDEILTMFFFILSPDGHSTLWKCNTQFFAHPSDDCFFFLCFQTVIVHRKPGTGQTLVVLLTRGDVYCPSCTPLKFNPFSLWLLEGRKCQVQKERLPEKMLIKVCCCMRSVPMVLR